MRVLVGWDDEAEAETIGLILNVDETEVIITTSGPAFEEKLAEGHWDIVLFASNFPSDDESLPLFLKIQEADDNVPIVGAWKQGEFTNLAKLISHGLHSHLMRDTEGDFIFLLPSMIEAAQAAVLAQRSRILAERLREEVDSVRRLQESVIPRDLPAPEGYQVVARYEPSQIRVMGSNPVIMAGGDYYDAFSLDSNKLILLVGDASGHGVKACMSIMTMHTLIRMIRDQRYPNTVDFVSEVNRRLCSSDIVQDEGGFITLLYSTLDLENHKLSWTAAGAPMPILQNLATNEVKVMGGEEEGGLPLAIDEDWIYEEVEMYIPENSRLLIFTDGLDEAFPADEDDAEQFGIEGIIKTMEESRDLSLDDALQKLFDNSNAATKGSGRHDDTSVVLLERHKIS
ncbi:MAG: PP2C family protein-serine/threonine phosphatase [Pirellulaceae bacterium]|jgi:serine phosphatase RsbU (regulator of sigma subunit)|nr:PP2C family protein-serine/threonine phosphatase [Pirellulaceae bacterium]HJN11292.1 PP2C family protein-serine/threonine phosphatase [Pirellulaceae bacterium]